MKIILYEDNTQLREVLSILLGGNPGYQLLGAYGNCVNILAEVTAAQPDLILMDIDMPHVNGLEGLKILRANNIDCKVLMLTVFDDNKNIFEAIRSGANGYILKKTPPFQLIQYIEDVLNGGAPMTSSIATQVLGMLAEGKKAESTEEFNLSSRERDVLNLLVEGYSYKLVAYELFISIHTVRSHIKKIYEKLSVNSKSEAVAKTLKSKL
ncbi:MAG: response regulator transcription factor [Pedobacter sp.]|nr:MAG: response regulator transcription factor [Pedobacter sp.]